ncbi:tetratricopeptide repeat protein [bacterium]|nr:tetratricopeptide repeat protein [bacterium]
MESTGGNIHHTLARWRGLQDTRPQGKGFARLAELLHRCGRHDEALTVLQEGLQRHPGFQAGLVVLGRVLLDLGRPDDAVAALDRVLDEDPENCSALGMLVEEAGLRRDWDAASRHLEALVVLQPEHKVWRDKLQDVREMSRLAADGRREGPSPLPEPDPVVHPGGDLATMTLVDIYLAQGYTDKALAVLRRMAAAAPHRDDVRRRLVELEGAGADPDAAAGGPGESGPAGDPDPDRLAVARRRSQDRRAADKAQFQTWLANINKGRERTP